MSSTVLTEVQTEVWILVFLIRATLTSGLQDWISPLVLNTDPVLTAVLVLVMQTHKILPEVLSVCFNNQLIIDH